MVVNGIAWRWVEGVRDELRALRPRRIRRRSDQLVGPFRAVVDAVVEAEVDGGETECRAAVVCALDRIAETPRRRPISPAQSRATRD